MILVETTLCSMFAILAGSGKMIENRLVDSFTHIYVILNK